MDWDQGTIGKHLFQAVQQYEIPEFQRNYSWERVELGDAVARRLYR